MDNGGTKTKRTRSAYGVHNELLKIIAEQNKEKLLEYDPKEDVLVVYTVINGRFAVENRHENYAAGKLMGSTFVLEEYRVTYAKAFRACMKKPSHRIIDIRCALKGKNPEWYRLYLVSVADESGTVNQIAGRFVSIQKDWKKSEQIRRKAEMDELTGLYNHKAFEEKCELAIKTCGENAVFLMLDVDDFKMINDSLGHAVGDRVLAQTGSVLKRMVEGKGLAGRMGGDEFALFASGFSSREDILAFCRKLRKTLKTITFDIEYSSSIGVCTLNDRAMTFQEVYFEADQALYAAKKGGKNQFILFDQMEPEAVAAPEEPEEAEEIPYFADADSAETMSLFQDCMACMRKSDLRTGLDRMQNHLLTYFGADFVGLIRYRYGSCAGIEECHAEFAGITARLIIDAAETGGELPFEALMNKSGELYFDNVKELKELHPEQYDRLVGSRIWSAIGHRLYDGAHSKGLFLVVNPRKRLKNGAVVFLLADYLAARLAQQELLELQEFETTHDHLTGLWNRNSYVLYSNRGNEDDYDSLGIVTTDIVGLSAYNAEFGYLNGSKRLVAAARALESVFGGFRIFRYDMDEMLVSCPNMKKADFIFLVKCMQEKAEDLDFPLAVGYSWSSHANMHAQVLEAEVVMDNDKLRIMHGGAVAERIEQSVIDEVSRMLEEGMYLVYLQPKVSVQDGATVGAEALVRQLDPDIGLVSPAIFIPVLERYNIIHMVDLFVLETVFAYQKRSLEEGRYTVPISVNFSKRTILQPDLILRVREMAAKYNLPNGLIIIEVTETVGDMDHVVMDDVANNLKTLGFSLSMDDFGTHYSNLATLIQYDFDSAKIDRSMVSEVTTNEKSRIVLKYVTALINELGIKCIVEGIETKEQVEILKETKCDIIQGFYFGKPVPIEEFYGRFIEGRRKHEKENRN